jgi:hypothetical protein
MPVDPEATEFIVFHCPDCDNLICMRAPKYKPVSYDEFALEEARGRIDMVCHNHDDPAGRYMIVAGVFDKEPKNIEYIVKDNG